MKLGIKDVADKLATNESITKREAKLRVTQVLETLSELAQGLENEGDSIQMIDYFSITRKHRAERAGVNPRTGEKLMISAKDNLSFKAGKKFKLNQFNFMREGNLSLLFAMSYELCYNQSDEKSFTNRGG